MDTSHRVFATPSQPSVIASRSDLHERGHARALDLRTSRHLLPDHGDPELTASDGDHPVKQERKQKQKKKETTDELQEQSDEEVMEEAEKASERARRVSDAAARFLRRF